MEGERWRERGSVRFRLREEREWRVFDVYEKKGGVLEVDGEGMLEVEGEIVLDVDERAGEKGGVLDVYEEREGVREMLGEKKGALKVDEG
jgi:hypothetical protein